MTETEIGKSIRRSIKWLAWATVLLYVALLGAMFYVYHDSSTKRHDIAVSQVRVESALCGLTSDLRSRIADSKAFLLAHPDGLPKLGITAATIQATIANEERTILSLSPVQCPPQLPS